ASGAADRVDEDARRRTRTAQALTRRREDTCEAELQFCPARAHVRQSPEPPEIPRPRTEPRRARPEGALPGLRPRLLLVGHQPAPAPADLLLRLHGGAAGHAPEGDRALRTLHVLRHPAVDVVLELAARVVERADLGRKPDQESALPG